MISAGKPIAVTTSEGSAIVIRIEVVYALPERYWSVALELASGSTVAQALSLAGMEGLAEGAEIDPARLAVFSRPVLPSTVLRDGDRLEILRPLVADPKQNRRARAVESAPKKR
jgi:hypothetical protein